MNEIHILYNIPKYRVRNASAVVYAEAGEGFRYETIIRAVELMINALSPHYPVKPKDLDVKEIRDYGKAFKSVPIGAIVIPEFNVPESAYIRKPVFQGRRAKHE